MLYVWLKKCGHLLAPAFFLIFIGQFVGATQLTQTQSELIVKAKSLKLDEDPVWKELLHLNNENLFIHDESFYLSSLNLNANPNPSDELVADLRFFTSTEKEKYICRFPARYFYLSQRLDLPEIQISACSDLFEFIKLAPFQKISLVFVSENVTQPSSAMGHSLLKIEGQRDDGKTYSYALSYFTDANTLNIPKLIYQSLIVGKKGYLSFTPYEEKINSYTQDEQRNLWEYELKLSGEQKKLLQLHTFELKNTQLTYFFQKNNCSTFIENLLSLVIPDLKKNNRLWTTPASLIKEVKSADAIDQRKLQPSKKWKLRAIESQLSSIEISAIKNFDLDSFESNPSNIQSLKQNLTIRGFQTYNDYLLEKQLQTQEEWGYHNSLLKDQTDKLDGDLILKNFKDPLESPQDSQVSIAYVTQKIAHTENSFLRLVFQPASHSLEDNNQQYFGETSLHLATINLLTNLKSGATEIEKFEIYSVASLIPYSSLTSGISGKFSIAVDSQYGKNLRSEKAGLIAGSLGYSVQLHEDLDLFVLGGLGLAKSTSATYLFSNPEVGFTFREIFNMKTMFSYSRRYNELNDRISVNQYSLTQSKYFDDNFAFFVHVNRLSTQNKSINSFDLTFKKYF